MLVIAIHFVLLYLYSGNLIGQAPYESGASCSNCPVEKSNCVDNLCSKKCAILVASRVFSGGPLGGGERSFLLQDVTPMYSFCVHSCSTLVCDS